MATFFRAANPIWYMVDHTGEPLNDEYYAFFLTNTLPYLPQVPARDPDGSAFWTGGIVQFQPSGTLPDNLYFNPELTYRIEIRHGNTQTDELIWEINNFVPQGTGGGGGGNLSLTSDNQVTNPQFAFISFDSPLSVTASGTYEVAPGWFLVLTGTGTGTVTQLTNLAGDQGIVTNPSYALRFDLDGWTTAYVYQRFAQNGSIWAPTPDEQNSAVTMSVTATANDVQQTLSLGYQPNGGTLVSVVSGTLNVNDYEVLAGVLQPPTFTESANSTVNPDAYVDMVVTLPPNGDVTITSLQAIGMITDQPVTLPFEQETVERQQDHLFHYYADSIILQPKNSITTAWNFGLNPWQSLTTTSTTLATQTAYTADQTIVHQRAGASQVAVGRAAVGENYGFQVTAVTADNQFALIQYIDPATIRPYWESTLSALMKARIFSPTHSTTCRVKMRLIHRASLPSTIGAAEPISSWTAGADPVFAAGWTAIAPKNDPSYTLGDGSILFPYEGMTLPTSTAADMTLGIVLYTIDNLVQTATADRIVFDRVSLVPNDHAIDVHPATFDQVLRECEYYYQKTFNQEVVPASAGGIASALTYRASNSGTSPNGIQWQYKVSMREGATVTAFNPSVAGTTWRNITAGANSGASSFLNNGKNGVFISNAQAAGDSTNDQLIIHASSNARLGR